MDNVTSAIFNQVPAAIIICTGDGYQVELANPAALKLWGKALAEVTGKPISEAFPELNTPDFSAAIATVYSTGQQMIANAEPFNLLRAGGREMVYLNISFEPFRNELQAITGFSVTASDITELVHARQQLNEVNQQVNFRNAVLEGHNEITPFAILIVDAQGKILSYNRKFVELWNMPQHIVDARDDASALRHAMDTVADPDAFINKVKHLYDHPGETDYDELLFRDGRVIERFGKAVMGKDDTYYGWAWHFRDITESKRAAAELQVKNQELGAVIGELQFVTDTIPQLTWATEPDGSTTFFNRRWLDYTGMKLDEILGNSWIQSVHPADVERTKKAWEHSVKTGEAYETEYRLRRYDGVYRWFLARGTPLKGEDNKILKWYGTTTDIFEQKELESELETRVAQRTADLNREKMFTSTILDASFQGIFALKACRDAEGAITDFEYLFVNKIVAGYLDMPAELAVGKSLLTLEPENSTNGFFDIFCNVILSGDPRTGEIYFTARNFHHWFSYAVVRIDHQSLVVTLQDVSEQKRTLQEVSRQKSLLDSIMTHSPSGITVTEFIRDETGVIVDGRTIVANTVSEKFTGIPLNDLLTKKLSDIDPAMFRSPLFGQSLNALATGEPFITQSLLEVTGRWLEVSVARMDENRLINIFTDITFLKTTQLEHERSSARLAAVFNYAHAPMFTFAPVYDGQGEIVDFRFVITNPTFAAYVGQTADTLNGALGSVWFPGYLTNGVFDMYKETFLTGKPQRRDVHYRVDQHNLYLDIMSTRVTNEVLVTFTDYTPLKMAQIELEKYVEELKRSNSNLQDFAYAASHDLKEPIRKIKIFAERLKNSLSGQLGPEQTSYFERMESAATRMNSLIEDLLFYNEVSSNEQELQPVDLNELIRQVQHDLDLEIEERKALIITRELFSTRGHARHLQQVFQNLLGNALKFTKPGTTPVIQVSHHVVQGAELGINLGASEMQKKYYVVEVADNGIGFRQSDAERIFNVFQRLHTNATYTGTGLGLSIVRKIIENHGGFVLAKGFPGEGSVFRVILPAE
jgi:PAS domain S-box-containing protein